MKKHLLSLTAAIITLTITAHDTIISGIPWYDDNGDIINAHGACIVEDGGKYWLFGEYKSDTTNAFPGFGCYSSSDLVNWHFERVVLPVQPSGMLGPNSVGERVKVMRCPSTGMYVMLAHTDSLDYRKPMVGLATSPTINGDYTLHGPLMYKGEPIRKWDMGTFQDNDGTGYLLIHHGPVYRLASDYMSADSLVVDIKGMGEAPAMFRRGNTYYILTSGLTSWERNDNWYFTAHSIAGPWTRKGLFCPEGSLTHNSQATFVYPIVHNSDTTYMYMGDRWSFPHQASSATYVWQPISFSSDNSISIPQYIEAWNPYSAQAAEIPGRDLWSGTWTADSTGNKLVIPFHGSGLAIYGTTSNRGGYARISVYDTSGLLLHSQLVDFYSKVSHNGLVYISRDYHPGNYTAVIEPTGEFPVWSNKKGHRFGSTACTVTISRVTVR